MDNRKMAVARSSSGGVRTRYVYFRIMDDVIFAHKPMLLDVTAQMKLQLRSTFSME